MPAAAESLPPARALRRRVSPLLGTFVEISLDGECPDSFFAAAFAELRALERVFNFHDPESELSRMNRSAGESTHHCSPEMRRLLAECEALFAASEGLFDPAAPASLPGRSFRDVLIDGDRARLSAGTTLNFNGVAKGFLVDVACDLLLARGARTVVVNAGGDLRREGDGVTPVWVRDPASPGTMVPFGELKSGAVATSAGYFLEDAPQLPYVDPRSGRAADAMPSVTVAAPLCVHADALTKLALFGGAEHSALERFGARAFVLSASP
jgi:FAD:protein FMN transferase